MSNNNDISTMVPSNGPTFDVRSTDPRGGMQGIPDASLISMFDNGAVRDLGSGNLTVQGGRREDC